MQQLNKTDDKNSKSKTSSDLSIAFYRQKGYNKLSQSKIKALKKSKRKEKERKKKLQQEYLSKTNSRQYSSNLSKYNEYIYIPKNENDNVEEKIQEEEEEEIFQYYSDDQQENQKSIDQSNIIKDIYQPQNKPQNNLTFDQSQEVSIFQDEDEIKAKQLKIQQLNAGQKLKNNTVNNCDDIHVNLSLFNNIDTQDNKQDEIQIQDLNFPQLNQEENNQKHFEQKSSLESNQKQNSKSISDSNSDSDLDSMYNPGYQQQNKGNKKVKNYKNYLYDKTIITYNNQQNLKEKNLYNSNFYIQNNQSSESIEENNEIQDQKQQQQKNSSSQSDFELESESESKSENKQTKKQRKQQKSQRQKKLQILDKNSIFKDKFNQETEIIQKSMENVEKLQKIIQKQNKTRQYQQNYRFNQTLKSIQNSKDDRSLSLQESFKQYIEGEKSFLNDESSSFNLEIVNILQNMKSNKQKNNKLQNQIKNNLNLNDTDQQNNNYSISFLQEEESNLNEEQNNQNLQDQNSDQKNLKQKKQNTNPIWPTLTLQLENLKIYKNSITHRQLIKYSKNSMELILKCYNGFKSKLIEFAINYSHKKNQEFEEYYFDHNRKNLISNYKLLIDIPRYKNVKGRKKRIVQYERGVARQKLLELEQNRNMCSWYQLTKTFAGSYFPLGSLFIGLINKKFLKGYTQQSIVKKINNFSSSFKSQVIDDNFIKDNFENIYQQMYFLKQTFSQNEIIPEDVNLFEVYFGASDQKIIERNKKALEILENTYFTQYNCKIKQKIQELEEQKINQIEIDRLLNIESEKKKKLRKYKQEQNIKFLKLKLAEPIDLETFYFEENFEQKLQQIKVEYQEDQQKQLINAQQQKDNQINIQQQQKYQQQQQFNNINNQQMILFLQQIKQQIKQQNRIQQSQTLVPQFAIQDPDFYEQMVNKIILTINQKNENKKQIQDNLNNESKLNQSNSKEQKSIHLQKEQFLKSMEQQSQIEQQMLQNQNINNNEEIQKEIVKKKKITNILKNHLQKQNIIYQQNNYPQDSYSEFSDSDSISQQQQYNSLTRANPQTSQVLSEQKKKNDEEFLKIQEKKLFEEQQESLKLREKYLPSNYIHFTEISDKKIQPNNQEEATVEDIVKIFKFQYENCVKAYFEGEDQKIQQHFQNNNNFKKYQYKDITNQKLYNQKDFKEMLKQMCKIPSIDTNQNNVIKQLDELETLYENKLKIHFDFKEFDQFIEKFKDFDFKMKKKNDNENQQQYIAIFYKIAQMIDVHIPDLYKPNQQFYSKHLSTQLMIELQNSIIQYLREFIQNVQIILGENIFQRYLQVQEWKHVIAQNPNFKEKYLNNEQNTSIIQEAEEEYEEDQESKNEIQNSNQNNEEIKSNNDNNQQQKEQNQNNKNKCIVQPSFLSDNSDDQ